MSLMFKPIQTDENFKSDITVHIPERRKSNKSMIMIHTRIDGFEQKINVPLTTRRNNE